MKAIHRGATEYIIECSSCGEICVTHEKTKKMALKDFKDKGWGVWDFAMCPYCLRN